MAKAKPESSSEKASVSESQCAAPPEKTPNRWLTRATVIGAVSFLFCATIYWLRTNSVFGHPMVDDAYYLLLGKGLATGRGYQLINTPVPGILPIYPPVYPWLLSVLLRLSPEFPQNIWLFKLVPVLSVLGAGVLSFLYFRRIRQVPIVAAYLMALFTVLNPSLVFFATSTLMSECFYMLLQMGALLAAGCCAQHWQANETAKALRWAAATGVLVSLAFLTRSIGFTLIVAILAVWLLNRWWKPLLVVAAILAVTALPWQIYSMRHAPKPDNTQMQQGYITQNYTMQFWQRAAGENALGFITVGEIPSRIAKNVAQIAGQQMGLLIAARVMPIAGATGFGILSVILFLLALLGWLACLRERIGEAELYVGLSLLLVICWPWDPTRFMLPLTALFLFYLLRGVQAAYALIRRDKTNSKASLPWGLATAIAGVLLCLNLIGNFEFIGSLDAQGRRPAGELAEFTEIEEMMKWVKQNVAENEVCASLNPALVYLYTNRKTVSAQDPFENWELWKTWGVRYLILTTRYTVPERDTAGKPVRLIYQSRRIPMLRIIDLGSASDRAPWPEKL
jgi:hypothetical protein